MMQIRVATYIRISMQTMWVHGRANGDCIDIMHEALELYSDSVLDVSHVSLV